MNYRHSRNGVYQVFVVLLFVFFPTSSQAQSTYTAQLRGTVKDSTGAVVPKVTITITNPATQVSETVATDEVGRYIFTALKPASYTIKVEALGIQNHRSLPCRAACQSADRPGLYP